MEKSALHGRFSAIKHITDEEFTHFQKLIYDIAGISLSPAKKLMVASRLQKRLVHFGLQSFRDYYELFVNNRQELQVIIDQLTTNETYFFREPEHFKLLADKMLASITSRPVRIWSAACSSGEEVYTLAMVMAECMRTGQWEVVGSDISHGILEQARRGHYPISRNTGVSPHLLKKYCLKGTGEYANTFLVDKKLKAQVSFSLVNLKQSLPALGNFDVIFIRNVLIYFDQKTKAEIIDRVLQRLKPGGYIVVSHTENLRGHAQHLEMIKPSVYRKRQLSS